MEVVYNKAEMERNLDEMEIEDAVVVEDLSDAPELPTDAEPVKLDYKQFDFGDLQMSCGRCGEITLMDSGVEGGIQLLLPTTDKHEMKMVCQKCGNFMRLYFTENYTKKKTNEPETEGKETESVQGVSEDN